tara:strand:+ start:129 stop:428 length:300 start_codon:yes stop_codon:yes gene_type:complete
MKALIIPFLCVFVSACGVSDEERRIAESECPRMIEREGVQVYETKVFDVYEKEGKVVAEVGYKGRYTSRDSYSLRYCVIDFENDRISLPAVTNQDKWAN